MIQMARLGVFLWAFGWFSCSAQITYEAFFPFDIDQLTTEEEERLAGFLAELNLNDIKEVEVIGHTDSVGTDGYNIDLSKRRAENLRNRLLRRGFNSINMRVEFVGERSPKYVQRGDLDRDRRVEVLFYAAVQPSTDLSRLGEKLNESILLPHLQFVSGQTVPRPYAWRELARLKKTLLLKSNLEVEIHGHVCCGPDVSLSEERAAFVVAALAEGGVSPSRLSPKGFGNSRPLVEEKSEADRARNRRVEVVTKKVLPEAMDQTEVEISSWVFPLGSIGFYPGRATIMRNTEAVLNRLIDEALLADTQHDYTFMLYDQSNNVNLSEARLQEIQKKLKRKKLNPDNFGWEPYGKHPDIPPKKSGSFILLLKVTPKHGFLF